MELLTGRHDFSTLFEFEPVGLHFRPGALQVVAESLARPGVTPGWGALWPRIVAELQREGSQAVAAVRRLQRLQSGSSEREAIVGELVQALPIDDAGILAAAAVAWSGLAVHPKFNVGGERWARCCCCSCCRHCRRCWRHSACRLSPPAPERRFPLH